MLVIFSSLYRIVLYFIDSLVLVKKKIRNLDLNLSLNLWSKNELFFFLIVEMILLRNI